MASAFEKITERVANAVTRGRYQQWVEALPSVEMQLAREDFGYAKINAATGRDANDIPTAERADIVRRARKYFIHDPLCRQAVRLFVSYAIGRGLSIQAESDDNEDDDADATAPPSLDDAVDPAAADDDAAEDDAQHALQAHADTFWEHADNQVVFSLNGQRKTAEKLHIEGEVFFVLFPGDDVTRVRLLMDCLEVVDVITNPEDYSEPWYYIRRTRGFNGKEQWYLYPDVDLFGKPLPVIPPEMANHYQLPTNPNQYIQEDAYVHHVPINSVGLRGYSTLTPALDWAKVLRRFLENRATISEAHASFSFKRTINGPASMVNNLPQGAGGGSVFGPFTAGQTYPGMARPAGSILSVNQGADWEPMNAQSGGANAYDESRNFVLQFCRAVGIPEHFFGDGSMGTRATSTMMERPVELLFTDFQNVVKKMYERLFAFALTVSGMPYNPHAVRVDAPKILEADTTATVAAIVELLGVLPEFDIEEMRLLLLNVFAMDNPQDLLPKIGARRREIDRHELLMAQAQTGFDPTTPDPADDDPNALAHYKKKASYQQAIAKLGSPSPQFGTGEPGSSLNVRKPVPAHTRVSTTSAPRSR